MIATNSNLKKYGRPNLRLRGKGVSCAGVEVISAFTAEDRVGGDFLSADRAHLCHGRFLGGFGRGIHKVGLVVHCLAPCVGIVSILYHSIFCRDLQEKVRGFPNPSYFGKYIDISRKTVL